MGLSNLFGTVVSAYGACGSFSGTCIQSQAGAKTPLTGLFSGSLVLIAILWLTPLFYYIPDAVLAAVIICSVAELVSSPAEFRKLWRISGTYIYIFVILHFFFFEIAYYLLK